MIKYKLITLVLLNSVFVGGVKASPYVGLEYGFGSVSHDNKVKFSDSKVLDPKLDGGILNGYLGYSFNSTWSIELGYSQFDLDDGISENKGLVTGNDGNTYLYEVDWDASIKAKQLSLTPVYTQKINNKWSLKYKLGLTYTEYKSKQGIYEEYELITNDDIESTVPIVHEQSKQNKLGGLVSIGSEYEVIKDLAVGANIKYQFDSFAQTGSINIGATYYF